MEVGAESQTAADLWVSDLLIDLLVFSVLLQPQTLGPPHLSGTVTI